MPPGHCVPNAHTESVRLASSTVPVIGRHIISIRQKSKYWRFVRLMLWQLRSVQARCVTPCVLSARAPLTNPGDARAIHVNRNTKTCIYNGMVAVSGRKRTRTAMPLVLQEGERPGSRQASPQSLVTATTFAAHENTSQVVYNAMVVASSRRTKRTVIPVVLRAGRLASYTAAQQTARAMH